MVGRNTVRCFGQSTVSPFTRYSYTGREHDALTGLTYHRARWYDPNLARFMNEDPVGFEGGLNLYAYVDNDPVSLIDPFGLAKYVIIVGDPGLSHPPSGESHNVGQNFVRAGLTRQAELESWGK